MCPFNSFTFASESILVIPFKTAAKHNHRPSVQLAIRGKLPHVYQSHPKCSKTPEQNCISLGKLQIPVARKTWWKHWPDWGPAMSVEVGLVFWVKGTQLLGVLVTHMIVIRCQAGQAPLHQLFSIVHLGKTISWLQFTSSPSNFKKLRIKTSSLGHRLSLFFSFERHKEIWYCWN